MSFKSLNKKRYMVDQPDKFNMLGARTGFLVAGRPMPDPKEYDPSLVLDGVANECLEDNPTVAWT